MLKILQVRLQQYVNRELPDVQAGFRKGRGTRDQIANIRWIIEKAREFQKTSISVLLSMSKPLTVDHKKLWKILQELGIPDHLTCLLRKLYAGQEATVWTEPGTRIQLSKLLIAKESSNYHTIALLSHASKIMLKILQARLQQYMNCELPDVQARLEKSEKPEVKLSTSVGS